MTGREIESKVRILKASSVIGGSSLASLILGVARMKVAAVTIGPAGVGLIGLFQNVVSLAATIGGLGIPNAAPREIGVEGSRRGKEGQAAVGRVVMLASTGLAFLAGLLFFLLRVQIANVIGDPGLAGDIGWLALAVTGGVLFTSQIALLTAFGQIRDAAKANVHGALLATLAATTILLIGGDRGPLWYVTSVTVIGCLVCFRFTAKLPRGKITTNDFMLLKPLVCLGLAVTASALVALGVLILVRRMVADQFGANGLGQFQASWALASVYLAVVLQAMSADFYPRLSKAVDDGDAFNRIINEQTEVALLLGGPIILAALGSAPLVIIILYGGEFMDSVSMFSWQLAGDVLRMASWPLSFGILAKNKRGFYFACEAIAWTSFALLSWLLLPRMGLAGAGAAYAGMYVAYLPVSWFILRYQEHVRWNRRVTFDFFMLLLAAFAVLLSTAYDPRVSLIVGIGLFAVFSYGTFRRLKHLAPWLFNLEGKRRSRCR